jgi:hypothetical protein
LRCRASQKTLTLQGYATTGVDYLTHLSDGAIDLLVEEYPSVPALHTHVAIEHLGGAVSQIAENEAAVSHRDAEYNVVVVGMWVDPLVDEQTIAGVKKV